MKKMVRHLSLVLALILAVCFCMADTAEAVVNYVNYHNARFGFDVLYPKPFKNLTESENGDGVTMTYSGRNLKIAIWGGFNVLEYTGFTYGEMIGADAKTIKHTDGKTYCSYFSKNGKKYDYTYIYFYGDYELGFTITYPKAQLSYVKTIAKHMKTSLRQNGTDYAAAKKNVRSAYQNATHVADWFWMSSLNFDHSEKLENYDDEYGREFYRVEDFASVDELKAKMREYFSEDMCEQLINMGEMYHITDDGKIYVSPADGGMDIYKGKETYRVVPVNLSEIILVVTIETLDDDFNVNGNEEYNFYYVKEAPGKWVFMNFPKIR